MKKIDITTDQWLEIHRVLRQDVPIWVLPYLKNIFEIHKNQEMIDAMQRMKETIQGEKHDSNT